MPANFRQYFSERGHPLLFVGEPCSVPVITAENYTKWYNLYIVMPDGSVQQVESGDILEIDDRKVGCLWVDHHFHPRLFYRLAEKLGGTIDERAVEVAAGRWMIEREDDDKYNFHDPSLD